MHFISFLKSIAKFCFLGEIPLFVLRKRGMLIGKNFSRQQGCYIDPSHCFLIEIGDNVTFSIRVTLLAHDASTKKILGYSKIGRIIIGSNVFIGANVTILPNVKIGDNSIVGANSVVTKDIPSDSVFAGNPARYVCSVNEFKRKNISRMNSANVFDVSYRYSENMDSQKIVEMRLATKNGIAFII